MLSSGHLVQAGILSNGRHTRRGILARNWQVVRVVCHIETYIYVCIYVFLLLPLSHFNFKIE